MSPPIRLEDFAISARAAARSHTPEELATEYRRGIEQGRQEAQAGIWAELTAALHAADAKTQDLGEIRRQAVQDMLAATAPVLRAITEALAADTSERLSRVVLAELERLSLAGIAPSCRIAAGMDLIEALSERVEAEGLKGIAILPGERSEITFDGGRIAIDPAEITSQIAAILADLTPSEEA